MIKNHLSLRLKVVASLVENGARLADIGSDHAFLPTFLIEEGRIDFAVAGEVVKGPFEIAKTHVQKSGLEDHIHVRLANGLAAIEAADQIDTIVIAGMGGLLISEILEAGVKKIKPNMRLILQPNNHEDTLREWLIEHQFAIKTEKIVYDAEKFYEMIVAEPAGEKMKLSELDLKFGPYLRREKSDIFVQKWTKEIHTQEYILSSLPDQTMSKYAEVEAYLVQLNEVLS